MWSVIAADLKANVNPLGMPRLKYWLKVTAKLVLAPQVQVVVLFRIAHVLAGTPLRPLAFLLRSFGLAVSGAELHPDARIGPGLALMHSSGIVIGCGAQAGRDLRLAQGVTLGEPGRGAPAESAGRFPTVGDHVTIGANAVVLGAVTLGDGCVIGANSVVTRDIPELTLAVGAPARVVKTHTWQDVLEGPVEHTPGE